MVFRLLARPSLRDGQSEDTSRVSQGARNDPMDFYIYVMIGLNRAQWMIVRNFCRRQTVRFVLTERYRTTNRNSIQDIFLLELSD